MPILLLVPAIYLLRTSPCVSSVLPSIASRRNSGGLPLHGDGIHELAASSGNSPPITRRLVVSYTTFSPLPPRGRFFSSPLTSCRQLLLFSEVECPVPPGLSSRLSFQKRQRQAGTVLSDCKGTSFLRVFVHQHVKKVKNKKTPHIHMQGAIKTINLN